jgi:hypothetical protein
MLSTSYSSRFVTTLKIMKLIRSYVSYYSAVATSAKEIAGNMVEEWSDNLVATLISAEATMGTADWPKARDSVEQIVKEDPRDARASFDLARLDRQSKQWRSAETNLG